MSLQLSTEEAGKGILILHVVGTIDLSTVRPWEEMIRRVIRRRVDSVVVDLKELDHISARGLKMLLACAANQSLMNGCLIVVNGSPAFRRMARMVGLWDLACESATIRTALRKAQDYRAAQQAGRTMLQNARTQSRRLARHVSRE